MIEIGRYNTKAEADLARLLLESHGIVAMIFDAQMNNMFGGGGLMPVRLAVDDDDQAEALRILSEADA